MSEIKKIFSDAFTYFEKSNGKLNKPGELLTTNNLSTYINKLNEGVSADSSAIMGSLMKKSAEMMLMQESAGLSPYATTLLPLIRIMWPASIVKESIRTRIAETPYFVVSYHRYVLYNFNRNDESRQEYLLPMAKDLFSKYTNNFVYSSVSTSDCEIMDDGSYAYTSTIPAGSWMTSLGGVAGGVDLSEDDRFHFSGFYDISLTGFNQASKIKIVDRGLDTSNTYTIDIEKIIDDNVITKDGSLIINFNPTKKTADVVFHSKSMSSFAVDIKCGIAETYNIGRSNDSSTFNQYTRPSLSIKVEKIHVNLGEATRINSTIPVEYVNSISSMYNVDAVTRVAEAGREVFGDVISSEFMSYLKTRMDKDIYAPKVISLNMSAVGLSYTDDPVLFRSNKLKDAIEEVVEHIINNKFVRRGWFTILGNPTIMRFIHGTSWNLEDGQTKDGVSVDYSLGTYRGSHTYKLVSSPKVPKEEGLYIIFTPSSDDEYTFTYYPMYFNYVKGYVDPNRPNVPNVSLMKMDTYATIVNAIGQIVVDYATIDGYSETQGYPLYVYEEEEIAA